MRGNGTRAAIKSSLPSIRPSPSSEDAELDVRQLQHHHRNALQRINALVATTPGLTATPAGRLLVKEVERRIGLASRTTDALFGLTPQPGSLAERLRQLSETLVELLADPDQVVQVEVICSGLCPAVLHGTLVRVANELIGNAVKHGFRERVVGHIRVEVVSNSSRSKLSVADDGWGLGCARFGDGQGLRLVRAIIAPLGGVLTLQSGNDGSGSTAEVFLPHTLTGRSAAALAAGRNDRA
jgi:two-component sensor histidine kinase